MKRLKRGGKVKTRGKGRYTDYTMYMVYIVNCVV